MPRPRTSPSDTPEARKAKRLKRIAQGKCPYCRNWIGEDESLFDYKACVSCRDKRRLAVQRHRAKMAV